MTPENRMNSTSPGAIRARRYRLRQARGRLIYRVEIDAPVVETLLETGWLSEDGAHDTEAVAAALRRLIGRAVRDMQKT